MKDRLLAGLPILAILSLFAIAIEASDSNTVGINTNQNISAFSTCKKVTNNSPTGKSVYIPTTSAAEWSSFYTHPPAAVTAAACTCTLPWGGTLTEGQSVTAYAASSVSGGQCAKQTRTCANGALSGSYQYQSCYGVFSGAIAPGNYCATCALENRNEMQGASRFLLNNDQASINRRCRELGFTTGTANSTYTSSEWCGAYNNARTKKWTGSSWSWLSCVNGNVKQATCY